MKYIRPSIIIRNNYVHNFFFSTGLAEVLQSWIYPFFIIFFTENMIGREPIAEPGCYVLLIIYRLFISHIYYRCSSSSTVLRTVKRRSRLSLAESSATASSSLPTSIRTSIIAENFKFRFFHCHCRLNVH